MSLFADARRAAREAALVIAVDAEADLAVVRACGTKMASAVRELESFKKTCSETVAELESKVKTEREALSEMKVASESQQKLTELKQRNADMEARIVDVAKQIKAREQQLDDLQKEQIQLLQEKTNDLKQPDNGLRHMVDLYWATTRVKWNLQTQPHVVEGFVAEPENVVPFKLSSNENSQLYIVNHIWDLMSPSEN